MTFELLMRPAHVLCYLLLLAIVAATPIASTLAKGWLYAHPPRLKPIDGQGLVKQGIPHEEIILRSADGILLSAWYTPPRNGALILAGHGYANVRSAEMHALFARHGYGVLSWDFRAHGKSQGTLCTVGYSEALDVEAALEYALAQPGVGHLKMLEAHPEEYERRVVAFFQEARNGTCNQIVIGAASAHGLCRAGHVADQMPG